MFNKDLILATSTIHDGNMGLQFGKKEEVLEHRRRFLEKHGVDLETFCLMECDHSEQISTVNCTNLFINPTPKAEVLLTNDPNVTLGLLTADCIPAVFYDPVREANGLAHLNRKTVAHDLAKKVVGAMQRKFDTDPKDLLVHFEPHIHAASYQFSLPLNDPTPPQLFNYLIEINGMVGIDFAAAHKAQLLEVSIPEANITNSPSDVATDSNYFSHHVSKTDPRKAGRHLTILKLQR